MINKAKNKYIVITIVILILIMTVVFFLLQVNKKIEIPVSTPTSFEKLLKIKGKNSLLTDPLEIPGLAGVNEDIFKDKNHVYYRGVQVFDANPEKFQEIFWNVGNQNFNGNFDFNPNQSNVYSGLFKDNKNVYFLYKEKFYIVKNIKPNDVQILTGGNREIIYSFIKSDGNIYSYYEHGYCKRSNAFNTEDLSKFKIDENKKTVEFLRLNISDPQSFEMVTGGTSYLFAKDNTNVYYAFASSCSYDFKAFENSDSKSFICNSSCFSCLFECKDNKYVYFKNGFSYNAQANGLDLTSFQDISHSNVYFYKDNKNVFYILNSIIKKIDLDFKTVWLNDSYIFDKNHIYLIADGQEPKLIFENKNNIDYSSYPYYLSIGGSVYSVSPEIKKMSNVNSAGFSVFLCSKYVDRTDYYCGKDKNNVYYIDDKIVKGQECAGCDIKESYKFEKPSN